MARIERATSPLPRECSATELHGHKRLFGCDAALLDSLCALAHGAISRLASQPNNRFLTSLPYLPGAGEGNRTLVVSLEGFCSTIELHPHCFNKNCFNVPTTA